MTELLEFLVSRKSGWAKPDGDKSVTIHIYSRILDNGVEIPLFGREFPSEKDACLSVLDLKHRVSHCLPGKLLTLLESWNAGKCVQGTNSTKCPNCGAPIENNKDCVYCGQLL